MKIFGRDLSKIGAADDEPLVLLRADSPFAPHMLRDFAARLDETGDAAGARQARDHAERIVAWQNRPRTATKGAANESTERAGMDDGAHAAGDETA